MGKNTFRKALNAVRVDAYPSYTDKYGNLHYRIYKRQTRSVA